MNIAKHYNASQSEKRFQVNINIAMQPSSWKQGTQKSVHIYNIYGWHATLWSRGESVPAHPRYTHNTTMNKLCTEGTRGLTGDGFQAPSDLPSYMVYQGQRSYYERPIERIYITIILKKVFHMHFAWLVQFNCIECIQAIYTFLY